MIRLLFKMLRNNRGELDLGGKETFTADEVKELVNKQIDTLVQPKIDNIVKDRLERERGKFADYEDLKKFKTEHEKQTETEKQKQLEAQGKYEEALKTTNTKLAEMGQVISQKDQAINNMQIGSALTNEIVMQGGYLEEALAMLKSSAEIKDGVVVIKGKDTNGLDQAFSVSDGVKNFFAQRPHLVKTAVNAGGGGSGAGGDGGKGGQGDDLNALNDLLAKQTYANDFKGAQETRAKIRTVAATKGITISSGIIA